MALLAAGAGFFPPLGVALSLLVPLTGIVGVVTRGAGPALLAAAPGAVVLGFTAPEALPGYAAGVTAGVVWGRLRLRGAGPWAAVSVAVLPFAVWTVGLAASGWTPFPEGVEAAVGSLLGESGRELPPERLAELQASSEEALRVLRRTWVASEIVWFGAVLVLAAALARRMVPRVGGTGGEGARVGWPVPRPFASFDVPDVFVGVLIVGLVLMLLLPPDSVGGTIGWNLVFGSAALFVVRGIAIQAFWMDRGKVRPLVRAAFWTASVVLFLPVYVSITSGIGLFDAWFDFRRQRGEGEGSYPFPWLRQSSGDDQRGTE
jgi:hypothetical protein